MLVKMRAKVFTAAMAFLLILTACAAPQDQKPTIIFGDLNWTSAFVQNRIAQYIVEKGYDYPTEVKFGATLPLFQGLLRGDTNVSMEIWLPNQEAAWEKALADDAVVSVGDSLGTDWQSAFVIPAYLQEQYPELDSIDDLRDARFKQLFATPATGNKARLVSCVIGWSCEEVNAEQIAGYGLLDHVEIINPGDGAAMNADLYGAYEKGEPWLGYQWGTNDPALLLDLVRLAEPPYTEQCWNRDKACAYEESRVIIAIHPDLAESAPEIVAMLRQWGFTAAIYQEVFQWLNANPEASNRDAALWWLESNPELWGAWVTDDARGKIQTALDAGEIPNGWPDA